MNNKQEMYVFIIHCSFASLIFKSYITVHLKQVFQGVYRNELETRLTHKPWKQEIAKIPVWPRIKAVAEFRLCVGHDCLGTHLHGIGICPDTCCMLCSLCGPTDRNQPRTM